MNDNELNEQWDFNTDIECNFYYDENSNNTNSANLNPYEDYILAGVVALDNTKHSLQELIQALRLPKNTEQIKFNKQFLKGDFFKCMDNKKVTSLLNWIDSNNLLIHYSDVNNLYYVLVEIMNSISDENTDDNYEDYEIKDIFYKMFTGKERLLQKLLIKYNYPNIKKEQVSSFILELINIINPKGKQDTIELSIINKLEKAKENPNLAFINASSHIMKQDYSEFYYYRTIQYNKSLHVFNSNILLELDNNMKSVNANDEVLLQVSNVITGIYSKLMIYINKTNESTIMNDIRKLSKLQLENIALLARMRNKTINYNVGFIMDATAISMIERVNLLLTLCDDKVK